MTALAGGLGAWWERMVQEASSPWEAVLLLGQMVFFSRFVVQWIATERRKAVTVPVAFWWLSLGGALVSLVALVAKHEPVLIVAQVVGMMVYSRNLVIHNRALRPNA